MGRGSVRDPARPVDAPEVDDDRVPTGTTHRVDRDEGLRATTLDTLATSTPVVGKYWHPHGGVSSQISDGAARPYDHDELGPEARVQPVARVVDACLVGVDPV